MFMNLSKGTTKFILARVTVYLIKIEEINIVSYPAHQSQRLVVNLQGKI